MNDINYIIFVYVKDTFAKVLSLDEATEQHDELIKSGYLHKATLNAKAYINWLLQNTDNVVLNDLHELRGKKINNKKDKND